MNIVKINGTECTLRFGQYSNDTIAIEAIEVSTGDPFVTCTVNWEQNWKGLVPYDQAMRFPVVVIKNYSENEGVLEDLVFGGVVTKGVYLSGSNGKVEACRLTPEWEAIAKVQLSKLKYS